MNPLAVVIRFDKQGRSQIVFKGPFAELDPTLQPTGIMVIETDKQTASMFGLMLSLSSLLDPPPSPSPSLPTVQESKEQRRKRLQLQYTNSQYQKCLLKKSEIPTGGQVRAWDKWNKRAIQQQQQNRK